MENTAGSRDDNEGLGAKRRREAYRGKKCFVIMPFGEKEHPVTKEKINFDEIFNKLIVPPIEELGLECIRSDKVSASGLVHLDMIEHILSSDVVVVDISTGNANVMYELGIRHTAKRWGTVIIRGPGHERIPFNINGMRVADYSLADDERLAAGRSMLKTNIENCLETRHVDSLVHTLFKGLNVSKRAAQITERKVFVWGVPTPGQEEMPQGTKKETYKTKLCIVWGDHQNIDMADLWVNPENTKFQMGRYHDNSISSYIRYWGAKRNRRGAVVDDFIANRLSAKVSQAYNVEPGTVVITKPGGLAETNRVQAIIHMAAQHGEPGNGYRTIRGYSSALANVLDTADVYNKAWSRRVGLRPKARSLFMPLFGTRSPDEDPQTVATNLVRTVKNYVDMWPEFSIDRVYFGAYTDADNELCVTAFNRLKLQFEGTEPPDTKDPKTT